MAAWRNWPPRYSGRSASSRTAATSSNMTIRSPSSSTRSCDIGAPRPATDELGLRARALRELRRREAARARLVEPLEQAELEPHVDVPRAVEAAEADHQLVERVVEAHGRIVTCCPRASGDDVGDGMQPSRRRACSGW